MPKDFIPAKVDTFRPAMVIIGRAASALDVLYDHKDFTKNTKIWQQKGSTTTIGDAS